MPEIADLSLNVLYSIKIDGYNFYYGWEDNTTFEIEKFFISFDANQDYSFKWLNALTNLRKLEEQLYILRDFEHHPLSYDSVFTEHDEVEISTLDFNLETLKSADPNILMSETEWLKKYGREAANTHTKRDLITKLAKAISKMDIAGFEKEKENAMDWLRLVGPIIQFAS